MSDDYQQASDLAQEIGVTDAAETFGLRHSRLRYYMRSNGIPIPDIGPSHDDEIDAALDVMMYLSQPGDEWSTEDIAEVCGISKQRVSAIALGAIQKLRYEITTSQLRDLQDFLDLLNESAQERVDGRSP